jgi:poly-gamma-glutamate system protein
MKKIYWRPHRVSNMGLFLIALLSLGGLVSVENLKVKRRQPHFEEKVAAARLARNAMEVIKQERLRRKVPIDLEADPAKSGLIGISMSTVTTDTGFLPAKQTSINPNFAGVLVDLLKRCGVREGDLVAVAPSGSFPAINISAYAALQTLKLKPLIISSAAASQWGANIPELLWIDMERILFERHLFNFRSVAASRGGVDDRGFGMSREGRRILDEAILRNGLQPIEVKSVADSINRRMQIYEEQAGGGSIKAYINIGGGTASVGATVGKKLFKPGLNRVAPRGAGGIDSVMTRFINEGVPVIHMVYVNELAERHGLPQAPTSMPRIGEGKIYFQAEYSTWLAALALAIILLALVAFIRMDIGFRILRPKGPPHGEGHPEQMV